MNDRVVGESLDITIIVKALNEEEKIEACLRSAQAALDAMPELRGEVLLADSVSTDRTVEIAAGLGVRIVQFEDVADRSCGAALQLGYQFARGRYIYVLDGDMQLVKDFLPHAYRYLQENAQVAGVGGKLIDVHVRTMADQLRAAYYDRLDAEQAVFSLGGGGLYRRDAIEAVGYLSNRWLPAFEEAELAVRLRAAGYRLVRLSNPAVLHSGHAESSGQMLRRLWSNRRIMASGMFLRSAIGRPWFRGALKACWFVFAAPGLYAITAVLLALGLAASLPWQLVASVPFIVWGGAFAALAWRKRSLHGAALAVASWHLYALGALRGFVNAPADPMSKIRARELQGRV